MSPGPGSAFISVSTYHDPEGFMAERPKSIFNTQSDNAMNPQSGGSTRSLFQIYVRVLAGLYMLMGIDTWANIIGLWGTEGLLNLTVEQRVAHVFFAVGDLVAAVGLWLLSSWGVVVWMACALAEASLNIFLPKSFGFQLLPVLFNVLSIGFYAVFSFIVSRENR